MDHYDNTLYTKVLCLSRFRNWYVSTPYPFQCSHRTMVIQQLVLLRGPKFLVYRAINLNSWLSRYIVHIWPQFQTDRGPKVCFTLFYRYPCSQAISITGGIVNWNCALRYRRFIDCWDPHIQSPSKSNRVQTVWTSSRHCIHFSLIGVSL